MAMLQKFAMVVAQMKENFAIILCEWYESRFSYQSCPFKASEACREQSKQQKVTHNPKTSTEKRGRDRIAHVLQYCHGNNHVVINKDWPETTLSDRRDLTGMRCDGRNNYKSFTLTNKELITGQQ